MLAWLEPVHPERDAHAAGDVAEHCGSDNVRLGVFELNPHRLGVSDRRQPKTQHREHDDEIPRHRCAAPAPCSARSFSAAIYAARAETSDGESCAPPIGGITPVCSFGVGTPWVIVRAIAAMLPSPHSHLPFVRSDPSGVPSALDPWHPTHELAWKRRSPSATISAVAPFGVGKPAAFAPASGWVPSGGPTRSAGAAAGALAPSDGADAGALRVVATLPV